MDEQQEESIQADEQYSRQPRPAGQHQEYTEAMTRSKTRSHTDRSQDHEEMKRDDRNQTGQQE